jgi:hypothetical protein
VGEGLMELLWDLLILPKEAWCRKGSTEYSKHSHVNKFETEDLIGNVLPVAAVNSIECVCPQTSFWEAVLSQWTLYLRIEL